MRNERDRSSRPNAPSWLGLRIYPASRRLLLRLAVEPTGTLGSFSFCQGLDKLVGSGSAFTVMSGFSVKPCMAPWVARAINACINEVR
jgi:hypothetical protein